MRIASLLALIAMLAGCASGMSKDECLTADWRAIGYEDGAKGLDASAVGARRAACANKASVTADMDAYLAGRDAGLEEFCRPTSGFDYGARGNRYSGACAGKNETAFTIAYQRGLGLYEVTRNYDAARAALGRAEAELDEIARGLAAEEAAIVSPATPLPARVDHLAALKALHDRRESVRLSLPGLRRDVDRAADDLADYRRELSS